MKSKVRKLIAWILVFMLMSADICAIAATLELPQALTVIGEEAFYGATSIDEVVVHDEVTEIRSRAFANSSITEINLPESIEYIADDAFDGCEDVEISAEGGSYAYDWAIENGFIKEFEYEIVDREYARITKYIGSAVDVGVPSNIEGYPVLAIDDYAFENCSNLTSVIIPEGVTSIGIASFRGCKNLTTITISDSVTSIGNCAFQNCSSLTNITIPDGVTSIGFSAFENCSSLTNITIPNGVIAIAGWAFKNCRSLTSIVIPDGVISIGDYAFQLCTSLTSITIPDSVTIIRYGAFYSCSRLTNITIPENVTTIAPVAFAHCRSLTSCSIPDGVTSIDYGVFEDCSSLTSIVIPDSVTSIGNYAFRECSNLTNIIIPDGVTSIGYDAFEDCDSLTNIIIPNGVTSIASGVFSDCANLSSITIPDSVVSIGDYAFEWCRSLTNIIIPNGVTSIGQNAFQYCLSLTSITIPKSVTSIGIDAFDRCASDFTIYGESGSESERFADIHDYEFSTERMPSFETEGTISIRYPESGNILEQSAHVFTWTKLDDAYSYRIALRDLTEYPDGCENPQNVIYKTVYKGELDVPKGNLASGHNYRLWVAAYDRQENLISQDQVTFSVRAESDASIPTCSQSYVSKQVPVGGELYFTGKVQSNGGNLQRITIAVVDNSTSGFCYYQTLSAAEMQTLGANLTEFDLRLVPAIDTATTVKADQDDHLTTSQLTKTVNMNKTGNYTVNIWAMNEGNSSATLVSMYQVEMVARDEDNSAPQIFYFEPESETGYKAQEYKFSAETTGNVASVKLYIGDYLVAPEVERELWNGFHFYDLKTPIWEAGTRECRFVVTSTSGETAEASCNVEVLDAEYGKLPTPVLTSPVPYSDGEARGVINSPFTVSWEANSKYTDAEISVNIIKDGESLFCQKVTETNKLSIPNTVLTEVGLYAISVVATRIGSEPSEFGYMPLRAYATEQAIVQELCLHDGETVFVNQGKEWKSPVSYDAAVHYFREYRDVACELCGLVLEKSVFVTEDYISEAHNLLNSSYCSCGYCTGYSSSGEQQTMNEAYSVPVYRLPDRASERLGYLYSLEEVTVLNKVGSMSYVSYWSSAYGITRYGFVNSSYLDSGMKFDIWIKSEPQMLDGVVATQYAGSMLTSYHADLDKAAQIFPISVSYNAEDRFSGTIIGFNSVEEIGYQVSFDLADISSGEWIYCDATPITRAGSSIKMRFSRSDLGVFVALESLCEMLGFKFFPDRAECISPTYEKSQVGNKLAEQRADLLSATCFLYKEGISEAVSTATDIGWVSSQPGYWVGRMLASGFVDGTTTYFSDLGSMLFEGKEQMGEEIVEMLVAQKIAELEMSYLTQQQELLGFMGELHNLYSNSDGVLDFLSNTENLYALVKLSDSELDLLFTALFDEKYGALGTYTSMSKEFQEIYSALAGKNSTSALKPLFKQLRNIRSNALVGTMFETLSKVIDLGVTMSEEEQLNMVYYKYKDVLVADLKEWAEVYKGQRLYVDIQEMIDKIENMPAPSTEEWKIETFFSAHPGEWAFSLAGKCATTIFSKQVYAIPFVGKAIIIIDATSAALNVLGFDLERSVDGYMILQASVKYYIDMAAYINKTVYIINKDNVETFIERLRQCVRWEDIMITALKDCIMGTQSTLNPLSVLHEEVLAYIKNTSMDTVNAIVDEYIQLLEVYYSLQ